MTEYEGCQYPQEPCTCERNYEGFSKQDLKDRKVALLKEFHDNNNRILELLNEVQNIERLLEEK